MRRALLSFSVAALIAVSACGGDDDRADTVPEPAATATADLTSPTSTAPTTTEPSTSTSTPSTTPETPAPTTTANTASTVFGGLSAEPASVVPTLDDLPSGWSPSPEEPAEEADGDDCLSIAFDALGIVYDERPQAANVATSAFSQSEFGPFISAAVTVDSGIDGDAVFDGMGAAFASCNGTVDSDGNTSSVLPMSFPQIGDDTFASRVDLSGSMFPVSVQFALARVDDSLVFAAYVLIGGAGDPQLLEDVLRLMVDRL